MYCIQIVVLFFFLFLFFIKLYSNDLWPAEILQFTNVARLTLRLDIPVLGSRILGLRS